MKKIKNKTCADKDCDNQFKPFKTTDKYCSFRCALNNKKPDKPRAKINQKSKKQRTLDRAYTVLRKEFLNRPENKYCPVTKVNLASQIHHKAGRVGKLYLDTSKWLAVSHEGHVYIHENPEEAYKKGWLIKSTTV